MPQSRCSVGQHGFYPQRMLFNTHHATAVHPPRSFVFLMEPIADSSLEQQVISRAHRMGARSPVHVELLAMRHTAESHMLHLSAQAGAGALSARAADAAATSAAEIVAKGGGLAVEAGGVTSDAAAGVTISGAGGVAGDAAPAGMGADVVVDASSMGVGGGSGAGGGGNQMESRGLRNLVLLHLRKVGGVWSVGAGSQQGVWAGGGAICCSAAPAVEFKP